MDAVKTAVSECPHQITKERNYQIDVLKMVMAVFVFICHTDDLLNSSVRESLDARYDSYGAVSVHIFFIISGFLMIKSLSKRNYDPENAGKNAVKFVVNKFKSIALPYWISNAMYIFMYISYYIYVYNDEATMSALHMPAGGNIKSPIDLLINAIPYTFGITNVGEIQQYTGNNGVSWYISYMLFAMIFLAYIAIKKRDFFVNVLSLIVSILFLGYWKNGFFAPAIPNSYMRIIRAICGLCFGVVAWNIYNKINELNDTKKIRICLTAAEVFIYSVFFVVLITYGENTDLVCPILLLMPIAVAITFSQKSYVSNLFKAKCLRHLGTISLYIYLNHFASMEIVQSVLPNTGYGVSVLAAAFITVILCFANYIAGRIIKRIFNYIKTK